MSRLQCSPRLGRCWRMQRALVCSGRRARKLQQLAVAAGRVRRHARAGMRWEERCGACVRTCVGGVVWLCGCLLLRARAVARWSQGRLQMQALGVLQERLVVQRMHVCSDRCLGGSPGQSRRDGVPKSRARSVLASHSWFSRLRLRQAKRQNGQGCAQAGSGEEVRRPGRLASRAGQGNVEWWNAPLLLIGVASRQAQHGLAGSFGGRSYRSQIACASYATLDAHP